MNKEFPLESNATYKVKLWSILIIMLILDVALNTLLVIFMDNQLYLIILMTILNSLLIFFFGTTLTKWIVFPFSVNIIKRQQDIFLNKKIAVEIKTLIKQGLEIIKDKMLVESHVHLQQATYKETSAKLVKLFDLIDIFSTINSQLIQQAKEKSVFKQLKVNDFFIQMNQCLEKIKELLKEVNIQTVKGPEHSLWSYYNSISEFERIEFDSKVIGIDNKPVFPPMRMFPKIVENDHQKFSQIQKEISKYIGFCKESIKPVKCCRRKRTSCLCCFKQAFGSTQQMGVILAKTFEGKDVQLLVDEKKKIYLDCMFFTATCEPQVDSNIQQLYKELPTFIICNPNAMYYQHMVNHPHAFYLRFFLNKNINVMIWNYRGYGQSNGQPDPFNIRKDSELLIKYMREDMNIRGKIGVYGRSLGGVPTTHLADQVDMVIVDRTFANFDVLADRKFFSYISKYLFRVGTCGWKANNVKNFIDKGVGTCYKVIMTEKDDEIVEVHSSLMVEVANEIQRRMSKDFFINPNSMAESIESMRFITNLEHDLYTVIEYQSNKQNMTTDENDMSTSGYLQCCSSKFSSRKAHQQISKITPADIERGSSFITITDNSQIIIKVKNNQQSILYKESIKRIIESLKIQSLNQEKEIPQVFMDVWNNLNQICNQMYNLQGAQLTFYDAVNINKQISPLEIKNFLILMKVYGATPEFKTKLVAPNIFNHRISREISLAQVESLCKLLRTQIESLSQLKSTYPTYSPVFDLINTHYLRLQKFFDQTHDYLHLSSSNPPDSLKYLNPDYIGHLISLKCGHTGQPSKEETYLMEKHLRAAGFLVNKNLLDRHQHINNLIAKHEQNIHTLVNPIPQPMTSQIKIVNIKQISQITVDGKQIQEQVVKEELEGRLQEKGLQNQYQTK